MLHFKNKTTKTKKLIKTSSSSSQFFFFSSPKFSPYKPCLMREKTKRDKVEKDEKKN